MARPSAAAAAPGAPTGTSEPAPGLRAGAGGYSARGNEPGWQVAIRDGKIDYRAQSGATAIRVDRPTPRPIPNGHRYETARLSLDVAYTRCNDDKSGLGYEHEVIVTADGAAQRGCGGARRADWDI